MAQSVSCFAEDPQLFAHDADIFWDARLDPSVIVAAAEPAGRSERQAFDLLAQPAAATVLRCGGRPEELRLASSGCAIRLSLGSGTLLEGPVRLSFHLAADDCLPVRIRALRAFDGLVREGRIPPSSAPFAPSARKMALVLATMDGLARGWSLREIAIALFGEHVVAADWGGPSDFLKSRVRRLVDAVADLGGDAYLELLRR